MIPVNNPSENIIDVLLFLRAFLGSQKELTINVKYTAGSLIYKFSQLLKDDTDAWQRFSEHPEWMGQRQRPRAPLDSRKRALPFVIKFVAGLGPNAMPNRVAAFRKLLNPFWKNNVPSQEIIPNIWKALRSEIDDAIVKRNARRAANQIVQLRVGEYRNLLDKPEICDWLKVRRVNSANGKLTFEVVAVKPALLDQRKVRGGSGNLHS